MADVSGGGGGGVSGLIETRTMELSLQVRCVVKRLARVCGVFRYQRLLSFSYQTSCAVRHCRLRT